MKPSPEFALQCAVAGFLNMALPRDAVATSFPAGGGGKARGGKLKASGLQAGFPDLLILWRGTAYCIELKADDGRVSRTQHAMHARLKIAGIPVVVCRSLVEVQGALDGWSIPLRGRVAA